MVNFCEIDKYAIKAYCAIHGVNETLNLGNISEVSVESINDFTMMTWGFPCQDISVAGKQNGFTNEEGNVTRSGLYYEGIRILRAKKPALSIIENVKNLTSKRFEKEFQTIISDLSDAGYNTYYKVLNAKNYGVPQNRERVFIVSIRKDLDNGKFKFPEPFDNGVRLKNVLEDIVDEKYYISEKRMEIIRQNLGDIFKDNFIIGSSQKNAYTGDDTLSPSLTSAMGNGGGQTPMIKQVGVDKSINNPKVIEYANCITAREDRGISNRQSEGTAVLEQKIVKVGNINPSGKGMNGNVFSEDGLSPTLTTNKGEGIKIAIEDQKYIDNISDEFKFVKRKTQEILDDNGELPEMFNPYNKAEVKDYSPTLTAHCSTSSSTCATLIKQPNYRIRKLTPKECFRLMAFPDSAFESAENAKISNSQLYKMAGNSIVVDVLYYIYAELYKAMPYLFENIKLGSFFSGIGAFEVALDKLYEDINNGNFTQPQVAI